MLDIRIDPPNNVIIITWITEKTFENDDVSSRQIKRCQFFINGVLLSIITPKVECSWKVSLEVFAKRLNRIYANDVSYLHPDLKDYSHGYPQALVTMRTLGKIPSDISNPLLISLDAVHRIMLMSEDDIKKENSFYYIETMLSNSNSEDESLDSIQDRFLKGEETWNRIISEASRDPHDFYQEKSCRWTNHNTSSDDEIEQVVGEHHGIDKTCSDTKRKYLKNRCVSSRKNIENSLCLSSSHISNKYTSMSSEVKCDSISAQCSHGQVINHGKWSEAPPKNHRSPLSSRSSISQNECRSKYFQANNFDKLVS